MNLVEKAEAVGRVLHELDDEIKKFQSWSSLKCTFGCGRCCFKPEIEATPLEFLPLALYIFREGKAEAWFDKFDNQPDEKICRLLDPRQLGAGLCTEYEYRGLICRSFGFSARVNKYNRKELLTCNVIKIELVENFKSALEQINQDKEVPIASDFYSKLHYIDPVLANQFMPINKAIQRALEMTWEYFRYKNQEDQWPSDKIL